MRVFAYCTWEAREAVTEATGVLPVASPPMALQQFDPEWLEDRDLIYFRLHGDRDQGVWYGDREGKLLPALDEKAIKRADLGGATVVVANCYGADNDVMLQALYQAGAGTVIAGPGENYAAGGRVVGVDKLVRSVIHWMRWGMGAARALRVARVGLASTWWRKADRDAFGFGVVRGA